MKIVDVNMKTSSSPASTRDPLLVGEERCLSLCYKEVPCFLPLPEWRDSGAHFVPTHNDISDNTTHLSDLEI